MHVDGASGCGPTHADPGAVVALPHSGNWDLAGAWACCSGMPVTTVAEQLGEAEYAAFVAFREQLGMEILSHRDPTVIAAADRGASGGAGWSACWPTGTCAGPGVPVDLAGGRRITMPAGPALVARRSGAALIPGVCRYVRSPTCTIDARDPTVEPEPGRDGLVAMTQQVADFFAAQIAGSRRTGTCCSRSSRAVRR